MFLDSFPGRMKLVYLNEALTLEPYNKSMKHSLAELDFKRSRNTKEQVEKLAWRRSARERAEALTNGSINSYRPPRAHMQMPSIPFVLHWRPIRVRRKFNLSSLKLSLRLLPTPIKRSLTKYSIICVALSLLAIKIFKRNSCTLVSFVWLGNTKKRKQSSQDLVRRKCHTSKKRSRRLIW
jgi:hypothetical protein